MNQPLNWANLLTLGRFVLTIPFILLLSTDGWIYKLLAMCVFLLAGLTDFFDGRIARKSGLTTIAGAFLDPLADKVIVIAAFVCFITLDPTLYPFWLLILLIAREFLLTYVRLAALEDMEEMKTESLGKLKTTLQMTTILLLLTIFILREYVNGPAIVKPGMAVTLFIENQVPGIIGQILAHLPLAFIILSVGLTLWSGAQYLVRNRHLFRGHQD